MEDELEELIDAAHDLYGDHSIYEVMDLDRPDAIERKVEIYGPPVGERIERYFAVLDRTRAWREPSPLYLPNTCNGRLLARGVDPGCRDEDLAERLRSELA
ncbi:MAG: hypothetical protein WBN83_08625 [Desulfoprunum sp.]|jgi:predicted metal-dependent hydrolase|uniref:hypothetical protein n=1 Tax=Desulfoprunum sp. TaxID=2020866 RepID=UPI00052CF8AF|nr:hypothetical protein JT06_03900 [Desulfobulbus sp. Tol-SR]